MTPSMDQSRPDQSARHRAEQGSAVENKSQTVLKKAATVRVMSQRMAVVAGGIAVLLAVGTAGQAAEQSLTQTSAVQPAESETSTPTPSASAQSATPAETAAPKPAEAPAPAAAPAAPPAAPAPAPVAPVEVAPPAPAPVPVAIDDPAAAQAYAASKLAAYGWGQDQMGSLITLWEKESNWRTTATNPSSGAYGIVQSLPASKMASVAPDWETNFRTQIDWGLNYIKERYGSPANALGFHYANNWY